MFELIGAGLTIAEKIFGAASRAKALNLSFTAILRSLYFEITANLRTLEVIDTAKLRPGNLAALAAALEIETCAAVLFADDAANAEAQEFLAKQGKVPESSEAPASGEEASAGGEAEDGAKGAKRQKTVLQALLFIVQRVIALQKIAAVYAGDGGENALINVRVPVRIQNIQEHLLFVKREMVEFDKNQHFLFGKEY